MDFTLEDVDKCVREHIENNQKLLEDKLKAFTPIPEDKIKDIVSKKIMEFDVPVNKTEAKNPYQVFKETLNDINKVK